MHRRRGLGGAGDRRDARSVGIHNLIAVNVRLLGREERALKLSLFGSHALAGSDQRSHAHPARERKKAAVTFILWVIAVVLVIAGIVTIIRGQILWGIVLIIVGLLVGPGGVSIFDNDDDAGSVRANSSASESVSVQS